MKICFVAPNIYPLLSGNADSRRVGGAELQQVQIGRVLGRHDYRVSYVTLDHGQEAVEKMEHFTVFKAFSADEGLPGFRFLHPRMTKLWRALRRADADVHYVRGAGFLVGLLAIFCRAYRKRFIFAAASDYDFIPDKLLIRLSRDKVLYKFGLRSADAIVVQSLTQQTILHRNFGLEGTVIPNFLSEKAKPLRREERKHVLWVSTIRALKRPFEFIRLARAFPHRQFVMIGGPSTFEAGLFTAVADASRKVSNLQFLGFQPFHQTEAFFDRCRVFVNTSTAEGFPNTFLQSWRRGIPVISFVDPDGLIARDNLGACVKTFEEMKEALALFLSNEDDHTGHIRGYFEENHSQQVVGKLILLIERCKG